MVVCDHDPNHILWFCDDVAAMKDGRLLAHGPAEDVLDSRLLETLYDRPIETADAAGRVFIRPAVSRL